MLRSAGAWASAWSRLITRMDQPLGRAVGNAVEVAESLACLRGEGPADLIEVSIELAAEMVVMGERAGPLEEARGVCRRTIADGSALERFRQMIEAQGGDPHVVDDPTLLPAPRRRIDVTGIASRESPSAGRAADRSCDHVAGGRPGSRGLEHRPRRGNSPAQEGRRSVQSRRAAVHPAGQRRIASGRGDHAGPRAYTLADDEMTVRRASSRAAGWLTVSLPRSCS